MKEVLVVEDEVVLRELWSELLSTLGFQVTVAANGIEAVTLIKDHSFTVIMTDLVMPIADGYVVLDHLKMHGKGESLVYVISGCLDEKIDSLKFYEIDRMIAKPFNIKKELEHLKSLL